MSIRWKILIAKSLCGGWREPERMSRMNDERRLSRTRELREFERVERKGQVKDQEGESGRGHMECCEVVEVQSCGVARRIEQSGQCSAVPCRATRWDAVRCSAVRRSAVRRSAVRCSVRERLDRSGGGRQIHGHMRGRR